MNGKATNFKQVTEAAHGSFEELEMEFIAEEEGYLMAYTSNQTNENLNVFMDQMSLTHTTGPIVRVDDYYPFGLTISALSSSRENTLTNKYLYQSKEWQNDLDLNIYDFEWRGYDPVLGRTWQIDPHSENYFSWSPYSWAGNNPILNIDPTGMDWYRNDETGELVWHVPTKHEDGTTNAALKGHTYLAGAKASFEEVRDNYNFVAGDNTFGGDNLMIFLDHKLAEKSESDDGNGFDQEFGYALSDVGGSNSPTGYRAEHTEIIDDAGALSTAASRSGAGAFSSGSTDFAKGLARVLGVMKILGMSAPANKPDSVLRWEFEYVDGTFQWVPYISVKGKNGGISPPVRKVENKEDSIKVGLK